MDLTKIRKTLKRLIDEDLESDEPRNNEQLKAALKQAHPELTDAEIEQLSKIREEEVDLLLKR
jgi:hypothetical protein